MIVKHGHWKSCAALVVAAAFLPGCILELLTTTAIQGELQAQNAAAATAQLDRAQRMADEMKIRQAIDVYRAEHRTNPPSLQALVPEYLDRVPVGPTGEPLYAYDPETGWFGPPGQQPGRTAGSAMPIQGTSPVAEQVQAIGLMNELNAGGVPPAAGRAQQQAEDLAEQQNDQYEAVLDSLNL